MKPGRWIKRIIIYTILVAMFGLAYLTAHVEVRPDEEVLVLRFGEVNRVLKPGLHKRIPFVEELVSIPVARIHELKQVSIEVILASRELKVVTYRGFFRINDPALFYLTVRNAERTSLRLHDIIESQLRKSFSRLTRDQIKPGGVAADETVRLAVQKKIDGFGVILTDFKITIADALKP